MPLFDGVQDLALLRQPLLRAFRQARLEEQDLIFPSRCADIIAEVALRSSCSALSPD